MARLCPLYSGSKGNSYYIGSKQEGILIDAGRSAKQLEQMLAAAGLAPTAVRGIFITHEHTDHISALRVFAKRYSLPVFGSRGTIRAIKAAIGELEAYEMHSSMQLAGMQVDCFPTSHDCAEPLGFTVKTAEGRKAAFSTDLGFVSYEVEQAILGSDLCVIESNHDVDMLRSGPYPYPLQMRILSDKGHLSNATCAELLPRLAKSGTRRFMLAHLSEENNSRRLAIEASLSALTKAGFIQGEDFLLDAAMPLNVEGRVVVF